MLPHLPAAARRAGRCLLLAPLVLALGAGCSQKTEAPLLDSAIKQPISVANAVIFIDAQRQDSAALRQLKPQDIASINVVKGEEARNYDPAASAPGVLLVTTKQNQNRPDVVAFNDRQHLGTAATRALAQKIAQLPPDAAYFLNGKPSTREAIAGLDSTTITRTDVLQGAQAAALAHDSNVQLAIAVKTH
jgi:hypothetical protein